MIKYICNFCGQEIDGKDLVRMELRIRSRLPRLSRNLEMHKDCMDKAFGDDFVEGILKEDYEKKERIAARKKEQEAAHNG